MIIKDGFKENITNYAEMTQKRTFKARIPKI